MHQLNSGDDNAGIAEPLNAKHDVDRRLDDPVGLFDQIIQIFLGSNLRVKGSQAINLNRSATAICNMARWAAVP